MKWLRGRGEENRAWAAWLYDLIEVLDDATNETYYAQLVEEESARTGMAALQDGIARQGRRGISPQ